MNQYPLISQNFSVGRWTVFLNGRRLGALLCSTAIVSTLMLFSSSASAQEAVSDLQEDGETVSILLRGTTGSGQQEAVFNEPIRSAFDPVEEDVQTEAPVRDTSDPERQLQGRVRPEQPASQVLDPLSIGSTPTPNSNVRMPVEQTGTGAQPEEDAFEATGFRVGSWRAFSSIEQSVGYSTNIDALPMGEGSTFSETQIDLSLQSDWSRHSARIDATGTLQKGFNSINESLPSAGVTAGLNLDLIDGYSANFDANYGYTTESVTSSSITSSAASRPGVHTFGGGAEIARSDRKLFYSLRGSVNRTLYEEIDLTSGGSESQDDRNNTLYSLVGRVGYEASPALSPFLELEGGIRDYDLSRDRNGNERDGIVLGARAGVEVDLGEKLQGEVAVGYQTERFQDNNLEDLSSVTLDGNLVWSPERETTITLNAQTGFGGSTTANQNGSINFDASVTAERQITDRLSVSANAGASITRQDDGSRTDRTFTAGAGFNYWVNRFMALTGSVDHTTQLSTDASSAYNDLTVRGGVRFQR